MFYSKYWGTGCSEKVSNTVYEIYVLISSVFQMTELIKKGSMSVALMVWETRIIFYLKTYLLWKIWECMCVVIVIFPNLLRLRFFHQGIIHSVTKNVNIFLSFLSYNMSKLEGRVSRYFICLFNSTILNFKTNYIFLICRTAS